MLSVFFKIVYYRLLPEPRSSGDCHHGAYCDAGLVTSNYIGAHCSPIVGQSAKGPISPRRSGTSRRQVVCFNIVLFKLWLSDRANGTQTEGLL